jgi:hypothetical protein
LSPYIPQQESCDQTPSTNSWWTKGMKRWGECIACVWQYPINECGSHSTRATSTHVCQIIN